MQTFPCLSKFATCRRARNLKISVRDNKQTGVRDGQQTHAGVRDDKQTHASVRDDKQTHAGVQDDKQTHANVRDKYIKQIQRHMLDCARTLSIQSVMASNRAGQRKNLVLPSREARALHTRLPNCRVSN